jgi:quinol-cytochrome oxidoreductase complex cytochrome b subunit
VVILPAITLLFLAVHLVLVQKFGISVPPKLEKAMKEGKTESRVMPFFPNFFLREMMAWYVGLAVLGALAALAPWELGTKADPFAPAPAGIRPEWYFMAQFQTLKMIPGNVLGISGELLGMLFFGVAALAWLLVPLLDRPGRAARYGVVFPGLGIAALAYMTIFSILGYLK